jgi:hypothetical protein
MTHAQRDSLHLAPDHGYLQMPHDALRKALGVKRELSATLVRGIILGLLTALLGSCPSFAADGATLLSAPSRTWLAYQSTASPTAAVPDSTTDRRLKRADFGQESASLDARHTSDWIVDSGDNQGMPFVIVDKTAARVFVFDADGLLSGAAPALLGLAIGDDGVPGIGNRKLSAIRPAERTTPAGRFVGALGRNLHGEEILWVDYDGAISLHRVITTNPGEHRAQRLATPTPLDNRISYGCINVPVKFYETVVHPAFLGTNGIVYVLPEIKSAREVFGSYNVDDREHHPAITAHSSGGF